MKINAFGRKISRERAYDVIINDFLCDIVYAQNTESLEELLFDGWKAFKDWGNEELEEYIDTLCIENQPDGKI